MGIFINEQYFFSVLDNLTYCICHFHAGINYSKLKVMDSVPTCSQEANQMECYKKKDSIDILMCRMDGITLVSLVFYLYFNIIYRYKEKNLRGVRLLCT